MAALSLSLPIMPAARAALGTDETARYLCHDARLIGLGEDGPTHQPIEHLAMLRATPNMNVFRPPMLLKWPRRGKLH